MRYTDTRVHALAQPLGERVHCTGQVTQRELERYVTECTALVLPSLYEGFGFPPLEALACGRPVAVSRAGSLPEICGPEARYFDPLNVDEIAAALLQLARNPDDGEAARARRRAWARQFDWTRCATATLAALRRAATA